MYSKYLNNIQIREEPREPIKGGIPLANFLQLGEGALGGGGNSIQKICHLSIPVGLAIKQPPKSHYTPNYTTSITALEHVADETPEPIDEQLFYKLYQSTIYIDRPKSSPRKKRTTKKNRH